MLKRLIDRIQASDPEWSPHDVLYPALAIVVIVAVAFVSRWAGVVD